LNLESQGVVIHVGATKTKLDKQDQAKYVAEGINTLLLKVPDINIFLENSPHAGRNFGGDITDFAFLNSLIEQKERVKFCIDTAHAFVYGYNLISEYDRLKSILPSILLIVFYYFIIYFYQFLLVMNNGYKFALYIKILGPIICIGLNYFKRTTKEPDIYGLIEMIHYYCIFYS